MIRVAISGIPGRLATATAAGIAACDDLDLVALYNPNRGGDEFNGIPISANHDEIECDVVFESTEPSVVMDNLRAWRKEGLHAVVGTSGFWERLIDVPSRPARPSLRVTTSMYDADHADRIGNDREVDAIGKARHPGAV